MTLPATDDVLYDALLARSPAYESFAYVGVRTTGVFCRLTCPARKPKRENCVFFATREQALDAGYRPCLRCRPMEPAPQASATVPRLESLLVTDPAKRWDERELESLGIDASTARRAFRARHGVTFLQAARAQRLGAAATRLATGAAVVEAQHDAGFESASGFRAAFAKLLGAAPARAPRLALLCAARIATPIGTMVAIADESALHLLEFANRTALPRELRRLVARTRSSIRFGRSGIVDSIERELAAYFAGSSTRFETPLMRHGSAFERSVWDALERIAPGTTTSYGAIAAALGHRDAARAVARANGTNQIAIVVPCHRVVAADGALTGYGGKLWRKRWLLAHERRSANPATERNRDR